jgi:hypothetical protein
MPCGALDGCAASETACRPYMPAASTGGQMKPRPSPAGRGTGRASPAGAGVPQEHGEDGGVIDPGLLHRGHPPSVIITVTRGRHAYHHLSWVFTLAAWTKT